MKAKKPHDQVGVTEVIKECGGGPTLGDKLDVTHQSVYKWGRVPAHFVLECERLSGYSRYQIRPDIYGDRPPKVEPTAKPVKEPLV